MYLNNLCAKYTFFNQIRLKTIYLQVLKTKNLHFCCMKTKLFSNNEIHYNNIISSYFYDHKLFFTGKITI
jgi:hypothetical protein